jgi:hypothetical protein
MRGKRLVLMRRMGVAPTKLHTCDVACIRCVRLGENMTKL